jgi:hypothetical protein
MVPKALVGQFDGFQAVMVSAGGAHTMTLTRDGTVWAQGLGANGRLGLGDTANRLTPVRLSDKAFQESRARMVDCGDTHTIAITEDGRLWSFGDGTNGKLGHKDLNDRLAPEAVDPETTGFAKIATCSCGSFHSTAVTEDGELYTWGWARDYQKAMYQGVLAPAGLGHEDLSDKLVPTMVSPLRALGARVGCHSPLPAPHSLAVAMGTHDRLGAEDSLFYELPSELVRRVVETCDSVDADASEGLVRLVGGKLGAWRAH